MTTLKIKVTKEILEKSKKCGLGEHWIEMVGENCAVALAVRDIFPHAYVAPLVIYPFGEERRSGFTNIMLPPEATDFINKFDESRTDERPLLPEIEFEVSVPDEVIGHIDITEVSKLLENHPTLQLT